MQTGVAGISLLTTRQVFRNLVRNNSNNIKIPKIRNNASIYSQNINKNFVRKGSNAPPGSWWEKGGRPYDVSKITFPNLMSY